MGFNKYESFIPKELSIDRVQDLLTKSKILKTINKYDLIGCNINEVKAIKNITKNKLDYISCFNNIKNYSKNEILYEDVIDMINSDFKLCIEDNTYKSNSLSSSSSFIKMLNAYNEYFPKEIESFSVRAGIYSVLETKEELKGILDIQLGLLSTADKFYNEDNELLEPLSSLKDIRNRAIGAEGGKAVITTDEPIFINTLAEDLILSPYTIKTKKIDTLKKISSFMHFFGADIIPTTTFESFLYHHTLDINDSEIDIVELIEEFEFYEDYDPNNMGIVSINYGDTISDEQINLAHMLQNIFFTSKLIILESSKLTNIIKNTSREKLEDSLLPALDKQIESMYRNSCFRISNSIIVSNKDEFYKENSLGKEEFVIVYGVTYDKKYMDVATDGKMEPFLTISSSDEISLVISDINNTNNIVNKLLMNVEGGNI